MVLAQQLFVTEHVTESTELLRYISKYFREVFAFNNCIMPNSFIVVIG